MRTHTADGMAHIAGGTFRMGSDVHYPEERPAHGVTVDDFWIDRFAVTNAEYRRFVEATKYPGKGGFLLTGQVGDVMRESMQAAYSLVRARAKDLGINSELFAQNEPRNIEPERFKHLADGLDDGARTLGGARPVHRARPFAQ